MDIDCAVNYVQPDGNRICMTSENNLTKLSEYLENSLAKRLLEAYQKEVTASSVQSVLEGELTIKSEPEATNDNPNKD